MIGRNAEGSEVHARLRAGFYEIVLASPPIWFFLLLYLYRPSLVNEMTRQQQQRDLPCDTAAAAGEHWSVLVSLLFAARTRATPEFHNRAVLLRAQLLSTPSLSG